MELIEFHFRAGLDFTGKFPGWCEVEYLPSFGVGETVDHTEEITKKENRRKRKSQIRLEKGREYDSSASTLEGLLACRPKQSGWQRKRGSW